jgi:ATP-binding cassette subfamily B protein
MSLGMMMAAQYMAGQLDGPLQQFIGFMRSAQDAQLSLERLSEIHNQEDENASLTPGNAIPAYDYDLLSNDDFHFPQRSLTVASSTSRATDIRIENVSFRYNGLTEPVLHDINLNIPAGKVTAIVGVSGSGKTTLAKLLLGFYRPTKGQILIGNLPLHDIAPSTWRKRCGAVLQDGFIFSDTIANNITECDEHPDLNRLQQSVRIANVGRFIAGLPMGYNTAIGARGNGISQGQRQRLLIGRAVYKNPEFLFFDEATNALDANNERAIVQNLQQFYAGADNNGTPRTVLIIAHRLSTVRHADQIVVLENGRQIETGTHDELVAQRGHYFELIRNQLELGA